MKVYVDKDEWYPVYSVVETERFPGHEEFCEEEDLHEVDMTEEELADFIDVSKRFRDWQHILKVRVRGE